MRAKRKPNPPRRCIFCGGTPISKEHVWPLWMRSYLPKGQFYQVIRSSDLVTPGYQWRPGPLNRKGDGRSQKLRVVCTPCNNNWMSELQKRTKPILLPLIVQETNEIDTHNQELLAAWTAMFTMVYETCYPEKERIPTTGDQRNALKSEQRPPKFWAFWCAGHDAASAPVNHTGFGGARRLSVSNTVEISKGALTTCGIGGICLAILSTNTASAFEEFSQLIPVLVERAGFVRFWPSPGSSLNIRAGRISSLNSIDLGEIHGALRSYFDQGIAATRQRGF